MYVRKLFSVIPALLLVAACGGETPEAEAPEGADADAMGEEGDMGDEMADEEGDMGDEMADEEGDSGGEEEGAEEEGGGDEGMEE